MQDSPAFLTVRLTTCKAATCLSVVLYELKKFSDKQIVLPFAKLKLTTDTAQSWSWLFSSFGYPDGKIALLLTSVLGGRTKPGKKTTLLLCSTMSSHPGCVP